ncbi:MAG: long-chain fatty acid--CoA ligase [Deltaproteobacteria bacterium]|nr:long-chain fatty acid--CoA ligase [Deltaproteobacteria bacterium]NNK42001.1 long-chain fatty acid--CoA ligase [Myxococcales bacterium]
MATDTIPNRLLERAKKTPNDPAYYVRQGGSWKPTNWGSYSDEVTQAGRALLALGFEPGQTVCILGFNRPEWAVVDIAAMGAGGAPAGIYTTCSPVEVRYIVSHAEAPIILVENEEQWRKVQAERSNMPNLKHVVTMKGCPAIADDMVMTWEEFLAKGDGVETRAYLDRVETLKPDALATLIYTSGTTGPPKGVMLSNENLAWTSNVAISITTINASDCSLSYLPLSHIAEQMFTLHIPITTGARVYFAESIEAVPENLKEVQPTIFFGVPRIWEKFHAGISAKLKEATGVKAKLVKWAMKVGWEANETPDGNKGLQYQLANKLIYSKLLPAIGMGNARVCVTGAAPIAREVLQFFASLNLVVLEVYGQSEDSGPTSFNTPSRYRFGSVGPALPGVEVKIAEDDEIMVKGPNVFLGYYKDKEATDSTLSDGWLHSGDLGAFDPDGFLNITGRKKDIIITAGGKNITPKNLEAGIKNHPLIDEAVVIGDRRKYLSALVTIDAEAGPAWAAANGENAGALHQSAKLKDSIQAHIDEMNKEFARVEQIKKFTILKRNFTVEDGELTPTLKVKRAKVNDHFAEDIEAMYDEGSAQPQARA